MTTGMDGRDLRDALRAAMTPAWEPPSADGAFIQVVEFATDRNDEWGAIQERLVKSLGENRPMRWSILARDRDRDRDRPGTYVALVEFGSYPAAMANSAHPATGTGSPSQPGRHPRPPLLKARRPRLINPARTVLRHATAGPFVGGG